MHFGSENVEQRLSGSAMGANPLPRKVGAPAKDRARGRLLVGWSRALLRLSTLDETCSVWMKIDARPFTAVSAGLGRYALFWNMKSTTF